MSNRRRASGIGIGVMVFVFAAAAGAGAQEQLVGAQQEQPPLQPPQTPGEEETEKVPERPLRGLFGGSWSQPTGTALTISVFEEYANDLRAASDDYPVRSLLLRSGYFAGMRANLSYDRRTPQGTLALRGEGSGRYYPDLQEYSIPRFRSELDFMRYTNRSRSARVRVGQRVDYAPYYSLPVPGSLVSPLLDRVGLGANREDHLVGRESYISNSDVSYSRDLTPRTSLSVDGGYRFTYSADPSFDVRDLRVGGHALHRFTPSFGLRSGYGYRVGTLPAGSITGTLRSQDVDFGMEYTRPLSKTRRASFVATSGAAVIEMGSQRMYRMTANGSVKYDTPDRWALQIDYDRGVQVIEGFTEPIFSDGVMARLSGLFGPRIEASVEVGGAIGQIGEVGRRYHNVQAAAQVRYAFNRYMAVEVQGLSYQYDFEPGTTLIELMPRAMDRRGGRVSLVFWLPMTE